ncbi:MAG: bifunctional UDP-N-acetylmuramoyl-tripeptide:D-alanyl-D-alanine ligase/alanine racemase [Saprospiraceae bacterium]
MYLSLIEIAQITNAKIIGLSTSIPNDWIIETDSRNVIYPDKTIFIAFNGTHYNGTHFIQDLTKKGVKTFIIDQEVDYLPLVTFICVKDCLIALQQLAVAHREKFKIPIIGITGSNGKTIIKEWLNQLLTTNFIVCKNPKSHNSQLGVPLSVIELQEKHEIGIFEAGISQTNEMVQLQKIIQPNIGILSNLGDAHDIGFVDRNEKLNEKLILFETSEYFYYPGDQEFLSNNLRSNKKAISWGTKEFNNIQFELLLNDALGSKIIIHYKHSKYTFNLPFKDEASIENIIPCILISLDFNIDRESIQHSINKLQGIKLRLEQKDGINGCILINDSYSLDIKSLKLAFQFSDQQNQILERVLIISDFASNSTESENLIELVQLTKKYNYNLIFAIGKSIHQIKEKLDLNQKISFYSSTEELLQNLDKFHFKNQMILIKGGRSFQLERVFEELSLSNHESILEINLNSIAHNISIYKSFLNKETKIIAVVKAAAYGSGNYEIAHYLEHIGVHSLAVAYQDEAIHLRNKGIQCPIMVMNSGLADFEELFDNNIEPAIFSLSQLNKIIKKTDLNKERRIHLKLDTGMRRLGFMQADLVDLKKILETNKSIKVLSIFSHLSGSDSIQFEKFTKSQFELFIEMYDFLTENFEAKPLKHILNTGGISRYPQYQLDMVRIGIGMYGIDLNPSLSSKLEKSHRLKTRITQIKKASSSDKISYNQSGQLERDGKIAILSIGYADGLPRNAGINGYEVFIQGKKCAVVGAVCMDMCMVDVSGLELVNEGDEVEIFGVHNPIEQLANKTGRIPYEILCGISARVKRIFIEE